MGNMDAGNMYEMYGVAAGVIGGVSPLGGSGILLGTFAGAGVWQTLENGLNLIHAQVGFQPVHKEQIQRLRNRNHLPCKLLLLS